MKMVDYYEWLILLNRAKESGISEKEIKSFFQEQSKINIKKKHKVWNQLDIMIWNQLYITEYKEEGAHKNE